MSGAVDPTVRSLNDCGCCEGLAVQTPVEITNLPGLIGIAYRVGTHPQFKQSMLARLSSVGGLTTREDEDFSVALLDAWATVADVLTFYQERLANESYFRTATERRSLLELARLIGYELRPGVAASAYVAFTIEDAPGAPDQATKVTTINIGTKVQSVPGPGEQAQVFETVERIEARVEWNAMRPRLTQEQRIATTMASVMVRGVATGLKPGDSLLIVAGNGAEDREVKRVVYVAIDPKTSTTRLDLVADPPAPPRLAMPELDPAIFFATPRPLTGNVVLRNVLYARWKQADLFALAKVQNWSVSSLVTHIKTHVAQRICAPETGVFAFRQRAAIYGHNAPKWDSLPYNQRYDTQAKDKDGNPVKDKDGNPVIVKPPYPEDWDDPGRTLANESSARQIYLDRTYPDIVAGSWLILESSTAQKIYRVEDNAEISRGALALSAKVSGLTLDTDECFGTFKLRETTVLAQSEKLDLADLPIVDPVEGTSVVLDRVYLELKVGQKVILTGTREDLEGVVDSEILTLADVTFSSGFTMLTFRQGLAHSYVRETVTINANVALATHGETKEEVLGSGDASQPFQRFTLRQPPLTYISAPTPSGAKSTLQIRINGLLWHEVPTLYGQAARDRVFVTRTDDDGNTIVQFGDGVTGGRLPAGQENVRATYRTGIGKEGLVKAGQLSLLMTRALGVRSVSNPLPADGAAERESRDEVRRNAPLTVLTLDRVVSLQDYEDFARAFAGIAKARADWTWDGQVRGVFLTVAGQDGVEVEPESELYKNLLSAMQKVGDPHIHLRVQSYRKAFFQIAVRVAVDPDFRPESVLAGVEQSLRSQFSFEARTFGQPVTLSEVIAVIQTVAGVLAADVDALFRTDDISGARLVRLLPAAVPQAGADGTVTAAELLTLDPRPPDALGVMR